MASMSQPELLGKLAQAVLRKEGIPERDIEAVQQNAFRSLGSVLHSSTFQTTETGIDADALLGRMQRELWASGQQKAAERLPGTASKLGTALQTERPGIKRGAVLIMLQGLQGAASASARPALSQALQLGSLPSVGPPGLPAPPTAQARAPQVARPTFVVTPSEAGDDLGGGAPPPLSAETSRMSYLDASSEYARGSSAAPTPRPGVHPDASFVSESALVKDVLLACQGVEGRHCIWDRDPTQPEELGTGYKLTPAVAAGVGEARTMLFQRLSEVGWLYRRVRACADSCLQREGAVRQAMGAAMRAELAEFYRLLALLHAQAAVPLPVPGVAQPAGGPQYLTLTRLSCWLAEPMRRLRFLAQVGDVSDGLEGGNLAGAVAEAAHDGDPFIAAYGTKLLRQVCVPLFGMIRRWVLEGEMEDSHQEFFVAVRGAAGPDGGGDLWRDSYRLDESRLPPFVGRFLAQRILRAGKAINFLRIACRDAEWVQRRAEAASMWAGSAGAVGGMGGGGDAGVQGSLGDIEALVGAAVASVDQRLLAVLWRRHRLAEHFAALRRFPLLGRGDWVVAFLDQATLELDKPAHEVSEIRLNNLLRQALVATGATASLRGDAATTAFAPPPASALAAAQGELALEEEADAGAAAAGAPGAGAVGAASLAWGGVTDRLRVRVDRGAGSGETGWDVFRIEYSPAAAPPTGGRSGGPAGGALPPGGAPSPLLAVFTPGAMAAYRRLSALLWRLKRAEAALGAAWGMAVYMQRTVSKLGPEGNAARQLLSLVLRVRSDMAHFATNLQGYLQFEVMESAWEAFAERAAVAADLDGLIAAHEEHLATLLRRSLLEDAQPAALGAAPAAGAPSAGRAGTWNIAGGGGGGGSGGGRRTCAALQAALARALENMVSLKGLVGRLDEAVQGAFRLYNPNRKGAAAASAAAIRAQIGAPALAELRATLAGMAQQHAKAVAEFTESMPEEAADDVRFLLARLDFSSGGGGGSRRATGEGDV